VSRAVRPFIVCGLAMLAALATEHPALGQGAADDEETLIKRGLEQREKGDDAAALRQFQNAHSRSHSGRSLAQVALAEQALGHWVDAESHLVEAMRHDQEPWVARNMNLFRQALGDIQSHLGSLELTGGVAGAEVKINDVGVGVLPLKALRVPAGSVALSVVAPNHFPMARTVTVPAGGLAREPVVLVPTPTAGDRPPADAGPAGVNVAAPSPDASWSGRRKLATGLAAAGVASLAVGIVFHVVRNGRAGDFNNAGCMSDNGTITGPTGCSSRYDDVQQARNFAIGGYAGAAILGGLGAFLWFTD